MLDEGSKNLLFSKANNSDIWEWHADDSCGYFTLNALSLSFTKQQTTRESVKILIKKIPIGRKRTLRNISLLFFGVNFNVLKRTSLQALWNMLQSLKHWQRVVLSSIAINKWFLRLIRGITVIFSNNFIQSDLIRTCWKWKQFGKKFEFNLHLKFCCVIREWSSDFNPSTYLQLWTCSVHQSCTAGACLGQELIGISSLGAGDVILRGLIAFKICHMPSFG